MLRLQSGKVVELFKVNQNFRLSSLIAIHRAITGSLTKMALEILGHHVIRLQWLFSLSLEVLNLGYAWLEGSLLGRSFSGCSTVTVLANLYGISYTLLPTP